MNKYKNLIRQYHDFPKQGIIFHDINPLLSNWKALKQASTNLSISIQEIMPLVTKILCVEARGFIMGGILAYLLDAGCVPVRKKGKLPPYQSTKSIDYALEYGTNSISMDFSLLEYNDKIVLFDDVLATGGTAEAVYLMLKKEVEKGNIAPFEKENICFAFLLEIDGLAGKERLCNTTQVSADNIISLIHV
ncbi:MAG: adenine phosphoribosyltransferase [Bacteroidales bacterium]|jgi:adenine phosphoribosyltransferase|nr:adenine phosphoribosyltransferase [Bacteroidales bacterium]